MRTIIHLVAQNDKMLKTFVAELKRRSLPYFRFPKREVTSYGRLRQVRLKRYSNCLSICLVVASLNFVIVLGIT